MAMFNIYVCLPEGKFALSNQAIDTLSYMVPRSTSLQTHDGSLALHDGAVMGSADLPLPQAPPAPQPFPALDLPLPPPLPGTK
jgi:hypothetical protein